MVHFCTEDPEPWGLSPVASGCLWSDTASMWSCLVAQLYCGVRFQMAAVYQTVLPLHCAVCMSNWETGNPRLLSNPGFCHSWVIAVCYICTVCILKCNKKPWNYWTQYMWSWWDSAGDIVYTTTTLYWSPTNQLQVCVCRTSGPGAGLGLQFCLYTIHTRMSLDNVMFCP